MSGLTMPTEDHHDEARGWLALSAKETMKATNDIIETLLVNDSRPQVKAIIGALDLAYLHATRALIYFEMAAEDERRKSE
jgi:hypothetical protein